MLWLARQPGAGVGTAEGVSGLHGAGRGDLPGWGRLKGPLGGARLQEVTPTCAGPGAAVGTSYPNSYVKEGFGSCCLSRRSL